MKKFIVILFSIFFVFFSTNTVFADYASDYQNYINASGVYKTAYNDYLTARANYLASGSLDSQDKAKAATLKMLQERDSLTISYLTAMSSKIKEAKGMSDGDKNTLVNQINTEIAWYNSHRSRLSSAGSLQDLVDDSDEAKRQFNSLTILAIYSGLINLGASVNTFIRGELAGEITILQAKISEIKANQDKDVSSIERSLIDVQNKLSRSQEKDAIARDMINSIKPSDTQMSSKFQDAQTALTDSNSYLKEANQGLLQIITQIKTN